MTDCLCQHPTLDVVVVLTDIVPSARRIVEDKCWAKCRDCGAYWPHIGVLTAYDLSRPPAKGEVNHTW